jgi:hypothetical protein
MKNIYVLPTEKPSRLFVTDGKLFNYHKPKKGDGIKIINQNIYITSDEEIKEGDWFLDTSVFKENIVINRGIYQMESRKWGKEGQRDCKKIILTTDQDLIKDGVQAIDDEFLEWFVKNPSIEWVEVVLDDLCFISSNYEKNYKIIIPKEEPKQHVEFINNNIDQLDKAIESFKQETLEEVGSYQQELFNYLHDLGIIALQSEMQEIERIVLSMQEQDKNKFTKDDIIEAFYTNSREWSNRQKDWVEVDFYKWFEQFKKK